MIVRGAAYTVAAVLVALGAFAAEAPPQQFGSIGDFRLESGEVIRDCTIGYRTVGQLAADKSNVIVVLTWFAGRSADVFGWVGEGNVYDPTRFHIIVIDALGDGVSSSPSTSTTQPREKFPRFTVGDMVRSQHELLTRLLHIDHVYAVSGLSMGGMQTFEWIALYPDFMEKAVAITGTPKQTAYDVLLWRTELDMLETMKGSRDAIGTLAAINDLHLRTPSWIANNLKDVDKALADHTKALEKLDTFDYMAQLRAMIAHDAGRDFKPPLKPKMFIAVALQDQMVNPEPGRRFARENGTELVTLSGDCGHLAPACERDVLLREVTRFLSR